MAFDGENKFIPIKGISRAGADSVCEDGAMNEVIGLEYKEGSYVPYKGVEGSDAALPNDVQAYYIHKTSTQTNIIIRYSDGLFYMSEDDYYQGDPLDLGNWTAIYEGSIKDIEFIGNVISISTSSGLEYKIFQSSEYKDWGVKKEALPNINLRVDAGVGGKEGKLGVMQTSRYTEWSEGLGYEDTALSSIIAARGRAKEEGGLTGYIIACAAYRLKTGEYIKASNPVVLSRPMHKYGNKYYDAKSGSSTFTLYTTGGDSLEVSPTIGDDNAVIFTSSTLSTSGKKFSFLVENNSGYGDEMADGMYSGQTTAVVESDSSVYRQQTADDMKLFYPLMSCGVVVDMHTDDGINKIEADFTAPIPTTKLQYQIDRDIEGLGSLVDSLCIFISEEIDPYKDFSEQNPIEDIYHTSRIEDGDMRWYMYHAIPKSVAQIEEEIKKINNLYLVNEIPYEDIKETEWKDVELEGMLGDALYVRQTLPLSSFDYSVIQNASLDSNNSRLHVYNYQQESICGYRVEDFNLVGGFGQYENSGLYSCDSAYIIVDINSADGNTRIVRYFDEPRVTVGAGGTIILSPSITFHDADATSITILIRKNSDEDYYIARYSMSKSDNGGFSMFLKSGIVPNELTETISDISSYINSYNTIENKGYMRVSDTYAPHSLPYGNTYVIGGGSIVGLASLSIALSQDTFGQYPLLVFCTDGIYSMGVDTTGTGVYNNIAPFSREVCLNRNSICEIDGAVLFASSKGLMVASSQGVQEYLPTLNGEPKHLPQDTKDTYGAGLLLYKEAINNDLSTQLTEFVSTDDFIYFLSNFNTHVSYVSEKNKIIIYNSTKPYSYWIDIPTRNVTKLPVGIKFDNNNYPTEEYITTSNRPLTFNRLSANGESPCLLQSRPIEINAGFKSNIAVVVRGYFNSTDTSKYAVLLVLGSLDGINWQPLGAKQKQFSGGFNDLGCVLNRVSCKYIMVVMTGSMTSDSHIDGIELTKKDKYNNRLR